MVSMLRILVIEDSPVNMALTVAILENAGHAVLQADHAQSGMELARSERPDLILMDIIALTAFAMKGDEDDTRAAGCDGYITKPVRYREFLAELDRVMRRRDEIA